MLKSKIPKIAELRFFPNIKVPEFDSYSSMLDDLASFASATGMKLLNIAL